jgi:hypothetical protein
LFAATPASALNCGSKYQPACVEAGPPGIVLQPPAGGNPYNLQPLANSLTSSTPLWPRARGYKPYGFNAAAAERHGTTIADEVYLHEQMGATVARIGADWGGIQYYPNADAGGRPWDYASYIDQKYLAYVKAGIRPMLVLTRTPRRYTSRQSTRAGSNAPGCGTSDACWAAPRPEEAGRLLTFAADLAKRYPLAAGIEFWNEPNLANPFWGTDAPNPEYYATLLNVVHDAVKSVRPDMPVIAGALTSSDSDATQNGYGVLSVRTFLRRMLTAGAQLNMDAVSLHPYLGANAANEVLAQRMKQAQQQVVNAYADAGKTMSERLVLTETGASTTEGFTEQRQSDWLSYQYWMMDQGSSVVPLSDRTDAMFIHETVEYPDPPYGNAWLAGYGFNRVKNGAGLFVPKKAFCTFRTLFGGFGTCPSALDPPG